MNDFFMTRINDELAQKIKGRSYKENCTVPLNDLRYLHILHKDISGKIKEGELICNASITCNLMDIFVKLYDAAYPIEKMRLIDEYDADDEMSMRDNNSSCFNFRIISHTNKISKHGYGLAVDINPLYNPYVKNVDGKQIVEPVTAKLYLNREANFPYKLSKNDLCYKLFLEHGFSWGGDWQDKKDYQHFEI